MCVVVGKGHTEAIGAVALWKNINKYDTTSTSNNSGNAFVISARKEKTLKNGISMLFDLIR